MNKLAHILCFGIICFQSQLSFAVTEPTTTEQDTIPSTSSGVNNNIEDINPNSPTNTFSNTQTETSTPSDSHILNNPTTTISPNNSPSGSTQSPYDSNNGSDQR